MTDYYNLLGVSLWATDKEIKASYRKLAKRYHPDVVGEDPVKSKRMYDIQEAYNVLSDPQQREAYDAKRQSLASRVGGEKRQMKGGSSGQGGAPMSDMSQFERFFGFQPGKGMETYRDKKSSAGKPEGPIKPEEMFAAFFGNIKRK